MREILHIRLAGLELLAALVVVGLPALVLLLPALERFEPLQRALRRVPSSLRTDLGYLLLSPVTEVGSRAVTTLAIVGCALALGHRVGPQVLDGFGPVIAQPRWLVLVEMLVLGDLIYYWVHRLAHTVPFLWRFHAVHHSTQELCWASALRAHPVEGYIHVFNVVPLFLLGFPVDALAPLLPLITLYSMLIHSALPVSLRKVSYVANSPLFHRWHHALDVTTGTKNFAGLFPVFDAIFGTYHLPESEPAALGVSQPMPTTLLAQVLHPFRRPSRSRQPRLATLRRVV